MREVLRRRTSCIAAPRRASASLRAARAAPRAPSDAMREVSRRRSSCIAAPRGPRAAPRVPSDAVREVGRRRTSCIGAPRRPRAAPCVSSDAMREVSRRRTSCIGARGRTRAAIGAKPPPPIVPSAPRVRGCAARVPNSRGLGRQEPPSLLPRELAGSAAAPRTQLEGQAGERGLCPPTGTVRRRDAVSTKACECSGLRRGLSLLSTVHLHKVQAPVLGRRFARSVLASYCAKQGPCG